MGNCGEIRGTSTYSTDSVDGRGGPGTANRVCLRRRRKACREVFVRRGFRSSVPHVLSKHDRLGSTRLVTDENGNTVSRHEYIPFGEEIAANTGGRDSTFGAQDFVNQKFTGKERDQETGLDYFGARYYSSALGRFTSPDPTFLNIRKVFNPQRWNLYG